LADLQSVHGFRNFRCCDNITPRGIAIGAHDNNGEHEMPVSAWGPVSACTRSMPGLDMILNTKAAQSSILWLYIDTNDLYAVFIYTTKLPSVTLGGAYDWTETWRAQSAIWS